jgi:RimJ/RimL family protein N-acetyltransferase
VAAALAPFPVDASTFDGDEHVLALRHAQLTADPTEAPWLLRAAVLRASGEVVGKVGFHAPPDADGVVEIGYRVAPSYRRQGLATEMAIGLIRWGAEQGARACLASIRPDNAPSLAIIGRLGFERIGEQMDEIDGLEWVFTLPLTGALPSYDERR